MLIVWLEVPACNWLRDRNLRYGLVPKKARYVLRKWELIAVITNMTVPILLSSSKSP